MPLVGYVVISFQYIFFEAHLRKQVLHMFIVSSTQDCSIEALQSMMVRETYFILNFLARIHALTDMLVNTSERFIWQDAAYYRRMTLFTAAKTMCFKRSLCTLY